VPEPTQLYPIRVVANLTGVNPVTLRAWERRYGLLRPRRTDSGHRLYGRDDVARIREVLRLVENGIPISQVGTALQTTAMDRAPVPAQGENLWDRYRSRMVQAVTGFDEVGLEQVYQEALSLYPVDLVTRRLLVPLLRELGDRWASEDGTVAEEHFFAVYLRNKLGARFHHRGADNQGPRLLAACLPGEHHEIGLLLFALTAHDLGFRLVLLGANTPIDELAPVADNIGCDAIVLSGSIDPAPEVIDRQLPTLVAQAKQPVFVGGQTSVELESALRDAGALPLGNDLMSGLRHISARLGYQP
jgi:DNA-binding transcriptional MerR regulator